MSGKPLVRWMPQSVWLARTIVAEGSCDESNCNNDNSCASVARCPSASSTSTAKRSGASVTSPTVTGCGAASASASAVSLRASRRRDFDDLGAFVLATGVVHPRGAAIRPARRRAPGSSTSEAAGRLELGHFADRGGRRVRRAPAARPPPPALLRPRVRRLPAVGAAAGADRLVRNRFAFRRKLRLDGGDRRDELRRVGLDVTRLLERRDPAAELGLRNADHRDHRRSHRVLFLEQAVVNRLDLVGMLAELGQTRPSGRCPSACGTAGARCAALRDRRDSPRARGGCVAIASRTSAASVR